MKAIITTPGHEYGELISRYFEEKFPSSFRPNKSSLLEILSEILVGTKDLRVGPLPKPESLVEIRKVIKEAVDRNVPIPVLIPWGGTKPTLGELVDVAEVSALWQLVNLDSIVRMYHQPGLTVNIRIEDTGAYWLYRDLDEDWDSITGPIDNYSNSMVDLTRIVRGNSIIHPIKESSLMNTKDYFNRSRLSSEVIFKYLSMSQAFPKDAQYTDEYQELMSIGWTGDIPMEQREHYYSMYKKTNSDLSDMEYTRMLADYLGGSLSRHQLHGTAAPKSPFGYIKFSFVPQIPGAPTSMFNNTLYYRTIPASEGRSHIAPWRAKGYLQITNNVVKAKITSWNDRAVISELIPGTVVLTDQDGKDSVTIKTDSYIYDPATIFQSQPFLI
jgi:hypothetical protein